MRILYLKTDLTNKPLIAGGSVAHTLGVINAMCQLGHHVTVASSVPFPQFETMPLEKVVLLRIPQWLLWLRWKLGCTISSIQFLWPVLRLCRKQNYAAIYQRYSPFNITGILAQWLTKIPLILEFNGSEAWASQWWATNNKQKVRGLALMRYIEQFNLKHAHKIVVVSQVICDQLVAEGINPKKIIVAPNGVDPTLFDPQKLEAVRLDYRNKLGIHDQLVIGFSGTFSSWHDIEALTAMVKAHREYDKNPHFLFIGDGPMLNKLTEEVQLCGISHSQISFTGLIPSTEARNYLAACDIFVCPTRRNSDGTRFFGSPTKLFEYMSLGKPIIASDLEQIGSVIFPAVSLKTQQVSSTITNQVGILVTPNDSGEFVAAVQTIISLPDQERKKLGENARKKVIQEYTWDRHVEKILNSAINKGLYAQ